ncbi:MAG: hypothetical protein ACLP9L_06110 [Thermoguttaceae bacterium]
MKSKKKFDPKVIQQFFIDHTEKLVIGLVAVLFLFFAYTSVTLPGYSNKPDDFKKVTEKALNRIAEGPATKKSDDLTKFSLYADEIDRFKTPIDPGEYPTRPSFNWKPIPPRRLRAMPEVFAVEHLRAIPGRGAILGGGGTRGMRWIVVTGLVPYKKQLAEYRAKFDGAAWNVPLEDVPKYAGYFVQRAEVIPGSEPKWSTFMAFDPNEAAAKIGRQRAVELADPRFLHIALTSPLPLLVDATWGTEAVSPPQIPIVEHAKGDGEASQPMGPPAQPGQGMPGPGMNRFGGGEADPNRQVAGGGLMGDFGAAPGANAGGPGLLAPDVKPKTESASPSDEQAQVPEYFLLRFLDLDVKPNKQYEYRIFLVLKNPNSGLQNDVLEGPELAESQYIGVSTPKPIINDKNEIVDWPTNPKYAKWSQPCIADRVSGDMRLLGGPVVAARFPQEINAEVRVLLWLAKSGLNGNFVKDGLIRGTILNFPGALIKTPGTVRTTHSDLTPNCILVDLQGGELLPDRGNHLTSPGMILVMDESGNLVMHDEVAETKEWEEAKKQTEKREEPRGPPEPRGRGKYRARGEREAPPDIDPVPTRQGRTGR